MKLLRRAAASLIFNPLAARYYRNRNCGPGSFLDPSVHVLGWRSVKVGQETVLSADCWLNVNHRKSVQIQIDIGKRCFIGRRNFFSSGKEIRLRDFCLTGPDCYFLGSNHVYEDPFVPYISSGTTSTASTVVGVNCWLGAGVTVIGNVTVGHGSIVGALTVVRSDVPPFSIVAGNPARILKRYDIDQGSWVPGERLSDELESALPSEDEYLQRLSKSQFFMPKVAASKSRGDLP